MCSSKWTYRINTLFILIALLLSVPLIGGCTAAGAQDPTAAPDPAESEPVVKPSDPAMALDAALAFLREEYGSDAPAAGIAWQAKDATPGGLVGSNTTVYTAEGWTVTILTPVVNPVDVVYQVTVDNETSGFHWAGKVDATGHVMTLEEPGAAESAPADRAGGGLGAAAPSLGSGPAAQTVTGWLGYVVSTPAGAQFDDYLVLMPEGAGQVGVAGATDALRDEIVALRDKAEPGKLAHVWGTLTCDVPDYGGCQLLVTRLRYGAVDTAPEPVEGWQGTLVSNPPGAQFDDYLQLSGDYPVAYGLHSLDPQLQAQLEALRDTGTAFRVWGGLRTGVPDAFGSQIEVARIELD
jgi:hypothetical protein